VAATTTVLLASKIRLSPPLISVHLHPQAPILGSARVHMCRKRHAVGWMATCAANVTGKPQQEAAQRANSTRGLKRATSEQWCASKSEVPSSPARPHTHTTLATKTVACIACRRRRSPLPCVGVVSIFYVDVDISPIFFFCVTQRNK
jgi:hypothetical protein